MKIIKIMPKLILIISIILMIQMLFISEVQAGFWNNMIKSADDWIESGKNAGNSVIDKSKIKEAQNFMYNTLLVIGIVVSVIVGMILGIKYMTSAAEEQAKVKETLMVYVIGCIVTFGAFGIWKMVVELLKQV